MKISSVSVCYGELRSKGYPAFTNERYELTLQAQLTDGETANAVRAKLTEYAKFAVKSHFGDNPAQTEMDLPF